MAQGAWAEPAGFPKSRSAAPATLELNGRRIFAKGSNWVNPEIFPGEITPETYARHIALAKDCLLYTSKDGWIRGVTNGVGYLSLDGNMLPTGVRHTVTAGSHRLVFRITKTDGLPCAFVEGDVCVSDESWMAGHMDVKRYPACATPAFEDENVTPETFPFQYEPCLLYTSWA